jgi:hypothetical protein
VAQAVAEGRNLLKIGLKEANNLLLNSVTVTFSKDTAFRGVNIFKLKRM